MPRGSSRSRSRSNSRSSVPAPIPPSPKPTESKSPGLLKTGGAIAGGVLAGNMLSAAILSPRGNQEQMDSQKPVDPCAKELKNFIDCSRNANDISICEGFNEALKACRKENGPPPQP